MVDPIYTRFILKTFFLKNVKQELNFEKKKIKAKIYINKYL